MTHENSAEGDAGEIGPLRLGLIGAGPAGRRRVDQIMAETGLRLAMVHDLDAATAQACADHTGAVVAPTAEDLIAGSGAIVIATPLGARAELVGSALQARRSVLAEGLPAATRTQIDALYRAATAGGMRLVAARADPAAMALAMCVREAEPPRLIEVSRSAPSTQRRSEVGVCLDLMVDDIEAVCALMNRPPVEVRATVSAGRGERADAIEATVRFKGGAVARLRASRLGAERSHVFRITGREGVIEGDLVTGEVRGGGPDLKERIARSCAELSDARALLAPAAPARPFAWPATQLALQIEGVCRAQAI